MIFASPSPASARAPRAFRHRLAATAGATGLALTLAACGSTTGASGDSGAELDVLASFYPLQMVVEQVGGEHVSVGSLTPPGAEPHDVELSPAQVAQLGSADLVVYLSGFQAAVDDAVDEAAPAATLDAADVVTLQEAAAGEDEGEEDPHGTLDPHFWLDPSLMPGLVQAVADELTRLDPSAEDDFRTNAAALTQRFEDLDAQYETTLATCTQRTFVTAHAAFGYLAARYDLEQVAISGIDPEAEPSPARLAQVEQVISDAGVTTVFFETLVSPKVAQTLADDLGIQAAVLDPIEGVTEEGADYFTIAQANLEALSVASSCS
ncbi:metal ABC transporter substrate-binding protein [Cellulomonas soli]|uniref:Zinc ABC transporter substrate-binding protein n=1 Tax=Cellulomonas soli TaxID=931535 RepID=A0A512PD91_9CELL|nr:metal ABC transporter substrate-binding protein [Cellulomonas soli]NYI60168.1 zinc transport system substrate-binding protein [Cellulomonas soli]GEP69179.1 zinc ABC transporter substrate-binding protein [Cellulomonas soli]